MSHDHCLSLAAIAHAQSQALYNSLLLTLPQHILQRENLQRCFSDIPVECRNNVGIEVTDHTSMFWKNTYQQLFQAQALLSNLRNEVIHTSPGTAGPIGLYLESLDKKTATVRKLAAEMGIEL